MIISHANQEISHTKLKLVISVMKNGAILLYILGYSLQFFYRPLEYFRVAYAEERHMQKTE